MQKILQVAYCLVFGLTFIAGGRSLLSKRDDESERPKLFSRRDFTALGWILVALGVFALIAAVLTLVFGPIG